MTGDSEGFSKQMNDSPAVALAGKIMVVAVIILFLIIVFVLCLRLYAKYFWWRAGDPSENSSRRRRRFVFTPGQNLADVQAVRGGPDPSVLKSLPVTAFNPKDHKEGLECAVCLSELSEGEKARILPNCNHGFHVGCIDTWFQSHSTCPLCRNSVAAGDSNGVQLPSNENDTGAANNAAEPWRFPTNVLFWGNQTQVSSGVSNAEEGPSSSSSSRRPSGILVIDIPRSSTLETVVATPSMEAKSPIPTRLRSLTRLLSRGRPPSPCSPNSVDIEQGAGRS